MENTRVKPWGVMGIGYQEWWSYKPKAYNLSNVIIHTSVEKTKMVKTISVLV